MAVHFISPYRTDKNLGRALNLAIAQLNAAPDDWIVHTDQDVLWLLPDSKKQVMDILATTFATPYAIFGCMTNRLGVEEQLVPGMFEQRHIPKHIAMAEGLQKACGQEVKSTYKPVAAMMMCFKVSTWQKLGGFHENVLNFDSLFCMGARKAGMKVGIMTGVYVFHLYRFLSDNPKKSYNHLVYDNLDNEK